jgi:hypothetical protein
VDEDEVILPPKQEQCRRAHYGEKSRYYSLLVHVHVRETKEPLDMVWREEVPHFIMRFVMQLYDVRFPFSSPA